MLDTTFHCASYTQGTPTARLSSQMYIEVQVVTADINGDGETEVVAADTRGNVAAFNSRGGEVWERHLKSLIAQVCPLQHCPVSRKWCASAARTGAVAAT